MIACDELQQLLIKYKVGEIVDNLMVQSNNRQINKSL